MANDETPGRNVEALKATGVILEGLPEDYHWSSRALATRSWLR